jgi:hypothetical protein
MPNLKQDPKEKTAMIKKVLSVEIGICLDLEIWDM